MIHPWMQPAWARLVELGERLPHALLFIGPPGLGKRELADELAARLLCDRPGADGRACGGCGPCQWRLAGNHPDLHRVVPAADAEAGGTDGESAADATVKEAGAKDGKARSAQILIEQIRELQSALNVTGHHGARRVVVLDPAEAMNVFTANALLKLLEEPPAGCVFLLVSSAPRRLLPTIRSRCQQWPFARPDEAALAQWKARATSAMQALLAIGGGMPLAAERMEQRGGAALLERFVRDISALQAADALRVAGQWEAWLKSKEALAAGFGLPELADWMQRWISDLAALRLGGRVRFFPAQEGLLSALASRASIAAVSGCYNEITQIRKVSRHPLNQRLVLEDMLLRYARSLSGARG
jgi:DNA polymerase-3 subunit delta'